MNSCYGETVMELCHYHCIHLYFCNDFIPKKAELCVFNH